MPRDLQLEPYQGFLSLISHDYKFPNIMPSKASTLLSLQSLTQKGFQVPTPNPLLHLYEEERDWINNIHSVHYHYSSPAFFLLENVQVHVHINSTFVSSPAAILTSCILISTLINSTYMLLLYCMPWRRLCESKRWYYCGFSLTDTSLTLGSASPSFCSKPNPNPNPNRWPAIPRLTPQWQTALHPPPDPSEMSY